MLRGGELCVCQLNAVIGLAPSTVSAHLAELKDAGLVRRGRPAAGPLPLGGGGRRRGGARDTVASARGDAQIAADGALLARVTAHTVEELCRPEFNLAALRESCCPKAKGRESA